MQLHIDGDIGNNIANRKQQFDKSLLSCTIDKQLKKRNIFGIFSTKIGISRNLQNYNLIGNMFWRRAFVRLLRARRTGPTLDDDTG